MKPVSTKDRIKIAKDIFEQGGFTPVMNTSDGRRWHNDLFEKQREEFQKDGSFSEEKFKRNFCMSADNRTIFKKLFGKPTLYYRGEFFYSNYIFEYKKYWFMAGTAKGKGTGIEVYQLNGKPDNEGVIYDFLTEFHKILLAEIDDQNN